MGQEYSSLSMEERVQLGLLASQKLSQRQIAAQLGRSPATIVRIQPPGIDISTRSASIRMAAAR